MKAFKFVILLGLAGIMGATAFAQSDTLLQVKKATYSVPVQADLATQAILEIPVNDVEVAQTGDNLSVKYRLPAELVGVGSEPIQLSQASDATPLHNMIGRQKSSGGITNVADASCVKNAKNEKKLMCMIVYHSLLINTDRAVEFLNSNYQGSPDLPSRLRVVALFANEPSGIRSIELE